MTTAITQDPESFADGASALHETALFNPFPAKRAKALAATREQSNYSPVQWAKFDLAAGIRSREQVESQMEELAADSTMPVKSWAEYGDEVLMDHETGPHTLQFLIDAGFSTPSTLARYAHIKPISPDSDQEAETNMNARARSRQDTPAYGLDGVALPITHSDWEIDSREYQQSQAFGEDLDARVASDAREAIEEQESTILWNDWGGTVETDEGSFGVEGITTGNSNVLTGTASGDFGTASNVLDTLDKIQQAIEDQGTEGDNPSPRLSGVTVFLNTTQYTEVQLGDYQSSATDEPLMDRIERKYPYITLREAPYLTDGHVVYMVNDSRYFEVPVAQPMTSTAWDVDGGFGRRSKMYASRVPWVKEQPDDILGIARYTGA
jgi:hypothetical protein